MGSKGETHMHIKSGIYDVLASGSVISFEDNYIDFEWGDPPQTTGFRIYFKDDPKNKESRIEAEMGSVNKAAVSFYNFNNPLGTGNAASAANV